MSVRCERVFLVAALVVTAALSGAACDDNDTRGLALNGVGPLPTAPQGRAVNVSTGAAVRPAFIDAVPVPSFGCPFVPPFLAPFTVFLDGDGRSDFSFSSIQMQFVDRAGVPRGTMTLGPVDLARRFGSTMLPAAGTRAFPFSFPFGCAGQPTGTLHLITLASDPLGRERRASLTVPVR